MVSTLVLAIMAAAAAQTAQQFDLMCAGPVPKAMAFADAANVRLRVDLKSKQWCYADCRVIWVIAEIQPGVLFLEKESEEEKAHGLGTFRAVNRETGAYFYSSRSRTIGPRIYLHSEAGTCRPEPFSGFPEIKTKF